MYINRKMFKLFKIFAFLIIFLFFSLSYAFSSELIKKIEVKGNDRIPTATVLMFADFKINNVIVKDIVCFLKTSSVYIRIYNPKELFHNRFINSFLKRNDQFSDVFQFHPLPFNKLMFFRIQINFRVLSLKPHRIPKLFLSAVFPFEDFLG